MSGDLNRDHEEAFGAEESAEGSRQLIFAIINQALWDATQPQWQRAQDAIFFFSAAMRTTTPTYLQVLSQITTGLELRRNRQRSF